MEGGALLFYGQRVPTKGPHTPSPLHPHPLLSPVPSLSLPLEMEHNSEQFAKMIPTISICRKLEIYPIEWRSSRWEPGGEAWLESGTWQAQGSFVLARRLLRLGQALRVLLSAFVFHSE